MAYTINLTDGAVFAVIPDGTVNTSSSMVLVGKNYAGYGEFLDENFIHLLENSSNSTAPSAPLTGQLWWDSANNLMKAYDGSQWKTISAANASASQPTGNSVGDLWFDTTNQQLNVWTGSAWIVVGPAYSAGQGLSGAIALTINDISSSPHVVTGIYAANTLVSIVNSGASFTPAAPYSVAFPTVFTGTTLFNTGATGGNIVSGSNVYVTSGGNATLTVTSTGANVTGYINATGAITAAGNITGNYILGNGSLLTGLAATYGNSDVTSLMASFGSNTISTSGNITGGNLRTGGLISATGTITGGNLATSGTVSASGNITGNYILGNGSLLTGLAATYGNSNVTSLMASFGSNTISTSGSITGGSFNTGSTISAGGNITGGNVNTGGIISASGTITGGNVNTGGTMSSTGNITTAGYFVGNFAGNISGNLTVPGSNTQVLFNNSGNAGAAAGFTFNSATNAAVVTGNITGGNIITAGTVSTPTITHTGSNGVGNIGSSSSYFNQVFATATTALYADVAERFAADEILEAGTVVELGGDAEITRSQQELSDKVFGVISTRAAYLMNGGAGTDQTHPPVAMTGRVPVQAIGTIQKGDRLVSAGNGYARAARPGEANAFNVIGRALTNKTNPELGTVEAIVTIK